MRSKRMPPGAKLVPTPLPATPRTWPASDSLTSWEEAQLVQIVRPDSNRIRARREAVDAVHAGLARAQAEKREPRRKS